MNSEFVDAFSARLSSELQVLDDNARELLFCDIAGRVREMQISGQEQPIWLGPSREHEMLGRDVIIPTEVGDRCGRVICFGVVRSPENTGDYERSVIVYVPSSGTHHEGAASLVRFAADDEIDRERYGLVMSRKLSSASSQHSHEPARVSTARASSDKGLVARLLSIATGRGLSLEEKKGSYKLERSSCQKKLYVMKCGRPRVDLSGFAIEHAAVRVLSVTDAKALHLGSVRGIVSFDDIELGVEAFNFSIEEILR